MSTSLMYHAFGCRDYVYKSTKYRDGAIVFVVFPKQNLFQCEHCRSRNVILKGKRHRRIQSVPIGGKRVWLEVEIPRIQCRECHKLSRISPPLSKLTAAIPRAWNDLLSDCAE
jgi:transposase